MKTKPHLIAALLLVVSFITACNQESDCTAVITHYVSEETKKQAITPLTGYDTIKFLYNNKDTQVYVGQGAQSGWSMKYGGDPMECDEKYEYLIYIYNCVNAQNYTIRMESFPIGNPSDELNTPFKFYFKNVNVGSYFIAPIKNDSIKINGYWYYEPYYWTNGPDTAQYVMFCDVTKNPKTGILKIKYLNNELTLLK